MPHSLQADADAAKSKAALSSVFWSFFLTALKLVAGLASNSLGVLSEALHSALDLVAALITFFAVKLSSKPADEKHPFGHGKVENLSALAETALLVLTCAWIIYEAVHRLFFEFKPLELSWWIFGVVVISLLVDINRSAMLRRVAREHRSQALEADALHFTTDIWSSAVVLVGLSCSALSHLFSPDSLAYLILARADAIAALGVAGIVLMVSWDLAQRSITALMDGGKIKEADELVIALREQAPAYPVRQLRVRESGPKHFVDLTVESPFNMALDEAHDITVMLENIVHESIPDADIVVHMEPFCGNSPDLYGTVYRIASMHGLEVHGLNICPQYDGLHVLMHVEVDPGLSLQAAHHQVSIFEKEVERRIGAVHVISHIEPSEKSSTTGTSDSASEQQTLEQKALPLIANILNTMPKLFDPHGLEAWGDGKHMGLSLHCRSTVPTVADAHALAADLEKALAPLLPEVERFLIHIEPPVEQ